MSRGSGKNGQPASAPAPVRNPSTCARCGGKLEASGKVYFDVTSASATGPDGMVTINDMEFSDLNNAFDGHPCAIEGEFKVSCAECEYEPNIRVGNEARARISSQWGG